MEEAKTVLVGPSVNEAMTKVVHVQVEAEEEMVELMIEYSGGGKAVLCSMKKAKRMRMSIVVAAEQCDEQKDGCKYCQYLSQEDVGAILVDLKASSWVRR